MPIPFAARIRRIWAARAGCRIAAFWRRSISSDIHAELPISPEEARYGGPCELLRITRFERCSACQGRGQSGEGQCESCRSTGRQLRRETLVIQLPRHLRSGTTLALEGHGQEIAGTPASGTARRGRLYLRIVIRPCW